MTPPILAIIHRWVASENLVQGRTMIYLKGRRECRRTLTGAMLFDRDGNKIARVQNREGVLAILAQHLGKTFQLYLKQWSDFPRPKAMCSQTRKLFSSAACA